MLKRTKAIVLFAVLTALIISPLQAALVANASADSLLTPLNDKYYSAIFLRDCLAQVPNKSNIITSNTAGWTIFHKVGSTETTVPIGRWLAPNSSTGTAAGVLSCWSEDAVNNAVSKLGKSSVDDYLTSIGYTKSNKTENGVALTAYTINGSDTANRLVDSNHQSTAARYYAYTAVLKSVPCTIHQPAESGDDTMTLTSIVQEDGKYTTKNVKIGLAVETVNDAYGNPSSTTRHINKSIGNFDYNGQKTTCGGLISNMNSMAAAVASWNNSNPEDAVTFSSASASTDTKSGCETAGGTWNDDDDTCTLKDENPCAVEGGLGWIICPALTTLAAFTDTAYGILANNFLEIDSGLIDDSSPALKSWQGFRNIANILFVIAFLVLIYSQITGGGITNYGIKKILPRIIIAAILVNISYTLCRIAVDLSNIIGYGAGQLFGSIPTGATDDGSSVAAGIGFAVIVVAALAGAAALVLALGGPVILSALLAVAVTVLILMARQALIVILTVISPIAFVAYLLPNTEKWFKKWYELFFAMLVLFPMLAIVFGGSKLAAEIIANSAGDDNWLVQLTAVGVATIPLFASLPIINNSLKAAGSVGATLGSMAGARQKAIGGKIKDESRLGEFAADQKRRAQLRRANARAGKGLLVRGGTRLGGPVGNALKWAGSRGKAFDDRFGQALGTQSGAARAVAEIDAATEKAVTDQGATMDDLSNERLLEVAQTSSLPAVRRAAALRRLVETGGHQHIQSAYDYLMKEGSKEGPDRDKNIGDVQKLAASSLLSRKPTGVGASSANAMRSGTMKGAGYNQSLRQRLRDKKINAQDFANMDVDDHARFAQMKAANKLDDADSAMLSSLLSDVQSNKNLHMSGEQIHAAEQAIIGPHAPDGTATKEATNVEGESYKLTKLDMAGT